MNNNINNINTTNLTNMNNNTNNINTTNLLSSELPFKVKVRDSLQNVLDLIRGRSNYKDVTVPFGDSQNTSIVVLKKTTLGEPCPLIEGNQCVALISQYSSCISIFMSVVNLETMTKILSTVYKKEEKTDNNSPTQTSYDIYRETVTRLNIIEYFKKNKNQFLEISIIPFNSENGKTYCSWKIKHGVNVYASEENDVSCSVTLSPGKYGAIEVFHPNSIYEILNVSAGKSRFGEDFN